MTKRLPQSIDAEQAILGALVLYPDALDTAYETGLRMVDFFQDNHRKIYEAALEIAEQGQNVEMGLLINRLTEKNQLKQIGGPEYLVDLISTATTSANLKHYVGIVRNKAQLRQLIETAQVILADSVDEKDDINDVFDRAEKMILDITHNRLTKDFRQSQEVTEAVMERIRQLAENKGELTGMQTGYSMLDQTTSGFQKGDLVILAARPSMGKTALALNLGMKMAHLNNLPVAIFSLEMPAEQLISRMLSARARINGMKIRTGTLNQDERNSLHEAALFMGQLPLYIDDSPTMKVSEMVAKCRKLKKEQGLGAIIIDYIQLVSGSRRIDDRQQEVSEISRNLKAMARELEVPVIALSQLSRLVERRVDKRPLLSDLRESGALEQDADLVLFLYRDNYYNNPDKDLPVAEQKPKDGYVEMEVDIAKHRNGPTKKIILGFESNLNSFYNIAGKE